MDYRDRIELRPVTTTEGLPVPKRRAVVNTTTNAVIGMVSTRYKLLRNVDFLSAITPVVEELNLGSTEPRIVTSKGGAVSFFKFLGDKIQGEIKAGDIVRFGIEFFNSYDGSKKYGFHIIAERLVCINGLVVPKSITEIGIRHTASSNIVEVRNHLKEYSSRVASAIQLWKFWSELSPESKEVFAFIHQHFKSKKLADEFINRYKSLPDNNQNVWNLYNIFTYYFSHQMTSRKKDNLAVRQFDSLEWISNRLENHFSVSIEGVKHEATSNI